MKGCCNMMVCGGCFPVMYGDMCVGWCYDDVAKDALETMKGEGCGFPDGLVFRVFDLEG